MPTHYPSISPEDVVRVVVSETRREKGEPELHVNASEDYLAEEDFDRSAYGVDEHEVAGEDCNFVTIEARLNVEPRVEQNYWVLSVSAQERRGPRRVDDAQARMGVDLSPEAFRERFLRSGDGAVEVRLEAQSAEAKTHFDRWWADMRRRHLDS